MRAILHAPVAGPDVNDPEPLETASRQLPILMYHRIADDGPEATARWRVTPDEFEQQMAYLADARFRTVGLEEWHHAMRLREPLPGPAVVLTFDDAYEDFATHAWPVLDRYGLGALVFLVSAHVGGSAEWDSAYGEPAPLLGWDTARELSGRGVEFGSHCMTHTPLTSLSVEDMAHELRRSRDVIEHELGSPIDAIAYPHGHYDSDVERLAGDSGYVFGLTCVPGHARRTDRPLALPRQEIRGSTTFDEFVALVRG
jgi:peptidoglycan/xylan/chitin deacetylase (PgdA/CDA1 family)